MSKTITLSTGQVYTLLLELYDAAWHATDDTEEATGEGGKETNGLMTSYEELCHALDKVEAALKFQHGDEPPRIKSAAPKRERRLK